MITKRHQMEYKDEEIVITCLIGPFIVFLMYYLITTDLLAFPYVRDAIMWNEYFEGVALTLVTIPVSCLDICGSIFSCMKYRENTSNKHTKFWLETLVACTLMQFGGTTLTGLVLGQTPSWILSHSAFPALLLVWWLTFCCPFDLYYRVIRNKRFGWMLLQMFGLGAAISSGHAVTSWGSDKALFNTAHVNKERIAASVVTCLMCGTFSACGGGLLADIFGFYRIHGAFTIAVTPELFIGLRNDNSPEHVCNENPEIESPKSPRHALLRSFICACIYYFLLNPSGYLPWRKDALSKETGHLIICALQVGNHITVELTGLHLFRYIGKWLRVVLCIPPAVITTADGGEDVRSPCPGFSIVAVATLAKGASTWGLPDVIAEHDQEEDDDKKFL